MVIFKGNPNSTIATWELANSKFKEDIALCAHPAAYQDTQNLNQWVDDCLVPHIQQRAVGAPVILFLDKFKCHLAADFQCRMEELGVQLKHIPGSCT